MQGFGPCSKTASEVNAAAEAEAEAEAEDYNSISIRSVPPDRFHVVTAVS